MELDILKKALTIRRVEETFLELFSAGKLNGTVHTCIGQEMSALAFAGQLDKKDFIFSNHRCHGHYMSFTQDYKGLIAELMGKKSGVCGGIGSSQHLCKDNFFSNGIQGGIIPVAAGMALAGKLRGYDRIGVVFIGDGTLGEGVFYETMNIISKWKIPLLVVCEDNGYAQSTPRADSLSGSLIKRAEAFGIHTEEGNTWDYHLLMKSALDSIARVRKRQEPVFYLVHTYRLAPHSKGDDNREAGEIKSYREKDPINLFAATHEKAYKEVLDTVNRDIARIIEEIEDEELKIEDYLAISGKQAVPVDWKEYKPSGDRCVTLLNKFFHEAMADGNTVFIGEDVLSPYGGAFKVAKGLSDKFPARVFSTPISEAAITGIGNGLALSGIKSYVEIMFGDFVTLAMDQIINHAAKFYHMYNKQVKCPVVIRMPMGGGRGYGPTHSQCMDKLLIGIDNTKTVAINKLVDPGLIYQQVHKEEHPVIVIENKLDYGRKISNQTVKGYSYEISNHTYPWVRIFPANREEQSVTIVTYGGMVHLLESLLIELFIKLEIKAEMLIPTLISPIDIGPVVDSVKNTGILVVVEETSAIGGDIIASVMEKMSHKITVRRIAAEPVPIPSCKSLEEKTLVNQEKILNVMRNLLI